VDTPRPSTGEKTTGVLLDALGAAVAEFPFAYTAPPASAAPAVLPASGGRVALSLPGTPPEGLAGCALFFGSPPPPPFPVLTGQVSSLPPY